MRKLLILMLVLGFATSANALVISYQFRDSGGNPIASIAENDSSTFYLYVVASESSGTDSWQYGLYTSDGADGGGDFDINGAISYGAAGNLNNAAYYASWDGADFTAGMLGTDNPQQVNGDWFRVAMTLNPAAVDGDILTVSVQDYNSSYDEIGTATLNVIPEPMTIALLGLGGLFLRRRKVA